jgi:replicative DNA helicase
MSDPFDIDLFFRENLQPSAFAAQRARERLKALQGGTVGFKTQLAGLDTYVRLMPGQLLTIAGRSGSGKTAFGMQLVYNVAQQMTQRDDTGLICVFSAEMDGEALMLREACAVEKISFWSVQTGDCKAEEYQRLDRRLSELGDKRIYIDESPAHTLEHITLQLKALFDEGRTISLVLFDYTELAGEFDREESRRVNKITRGLATIAKKFNCPVVTLSQLNRDIEARADKTPNMRDLMHGGERDAACIVILVRPWTYDKERPKELVNAYVVKNRFGPQGDATLGFNETSLRFYAAQVTHTPLPRASYSGNAAAYGGKE